MSQTMAAYSDWVTFPNQVGNFVTVLLESNNLLLQVMIIIMDHQVNGHVDTLFKAMHVDIGTSFLLKITPTCLLIIKSVILH